jgi:hypothetical protein
MQPNIEADHLPPFSAGVMIDWRKSGIGTDFLRILPCHCRSTIVPQPCTLKLPVARLNKIVTFQNMKA